MREHKACQAGIVMLTRANTSKAELQALARRASTGRHGPSEKMKARMEQVKANHREDREALEAHQTECTGCARLTIRGSTE